MSSPPTPDQPGGRTPTAGTSSRISWPLRLGIVVAGGLLATGGSVLVLTSAPADSNHVVTSPPEQASPPGTTAPAAAPAFSAYAAVARSSSLSVADGPDGPPTVRLSNPLPSGAPLTLLVQSRLPGWVQVLLPTRPNGSTGWVRDSDVAISGLRYALDIDQRRHQLTLLRDGQSVRVFAAATGTGQTPTPDGLFFLKELLQPTNSGYGPYAYGLSGHSAVLTSFAGGDGEIGLHGTSDSNSIGRSISHGCIRLRNPDISYLAQLLPLGTPVSIHN